MNRIVFCLSLFIFLFSCNNEEVKTIPEEDFINILVDLNIADAALEKSEHRKFHHYDSVIYQEYIFNKYGYTRQEFDTTLSLYVRDLEKIRIIYDKVTEILQQKNTEISENVTGVPERKQRINIWRGQKNYELPRDGEIENINFNIPLKGTGKYTLSADIKLYPDDQSENPRIHVYFYKAVELNKSGQRQYFKTVSLEKDGSFNNYSITEELNDTIYTHIRGQILGHTNIGKSAWKKHAEVKNISLIYEPDKKTRMLR